MIIYVIIAFVAILIGMAISVSAFGTGGKRKKIFQDIYFSVEDVDGIGVLYTKTGEYSAILKMENPVQKYSANMVSPLSTRPHFSVAPLANSRFSVTEVFPASM